MIPLDEGSQGIPFSFLRYADDTTLMAESEEELKSLLMKMKEESEKVGLKFNNAKLQLLLHQPNMIYLFPHLFP